MGTALREERRRAILLAATFSSSFDSSLLSLSVSERQVKNAGTVGGTHDHACYRVSEHRSVAPLRKAQITRTFSFLPGSAVFASMGTAATPSTPRRCHVKQVETCVGEMGILVPAGHAFNIQYARRGHTEFVRKVVRPSFAR